MYADGVATVRVTMGDADRGSAPRASTLIVTNIGPMVTGTAPAVVVAHHQAGFTFGDDGRPDRAAGFTDGGMGDGQTTAGGPAGTGLSHTFTGTGSPPSGPGPPTRTEGPAWSGRRPSTCGRTEWLGTTW